MAVSIDAIRAVADRIAARQGLDVVEVEFTGAGKARALRVFLEKDAAGREELKEACRRGQYRPAHGRSRGGAERRDPRGLRDVCR